ncbi:DUF262 domain-containing protein [Psychromonas sp. SP041]|uniref:GmrSD restriction endonuclease domain-containing protein n=1 Tax=Psychromonas sp. SP041 TaxID=1365007 RepID=UPI000406C50C|nr:DUF262 domain-containing protein [Psychromonas sp. SP041]
MSKQITKALTTYKYTPAMIVEGNEEQAIPALKHPFLIPIYQRLYTWEMVHVNRLLHDLFDACKSNPLEEYFIGALVTSVESSADISDSFELIDGQQRLTTLWLIASVLVKIPGLKSANKWHEFLTINDNPRLDFSGRDADIKALTDFVGSLTTKEYSVDDHSWLKNSAMINARKTIYIFFNNAKRFQSKVSLQDFNDYLWSKASFVITQLHPSADKERFFDTMNSRGVQLEKHEILKSFMLNGLSNKQLEAYGKAWDLCADINGFILGKFQTDFNYGLSPINESQVMSLLEKEQKATKEGDVDIDEGSHEKTLEDIITCDVSETKTEQVTNQKPLKYRSPVSFPVFLLHVLRVFIASENKAKDVSEAITNISLDDKKLIESFEGVIKSACSNRKMRFIDCLLECRLLLDNFVIKGQIEESNEYANWQITSRLADIDSKSPSRTQFSGQIWKSITMLQSMMYFSPMNGVQRAVWLTKTLWELKEKLSPNEHPDIYLKNLKEQCNDYECSLLKESSVEQALLLADKPKLGTHVHHYWFYKLEYCLWELWFNGYELKNIDCPPKPKILNGNVTYRMRSVNSVEHVSAQSQNTGVISTEKLDDFGNLALISVSENSSYSDKAPIAKREAFLASYKKGLIQSLKLAHIFNRVSDDVSSWNDDAMNEHGRLMVDILKVF